jgi:hypothetical protein
VAVGGRILRDSADGTEAAGWLGDVATATMAGERAFRLLRERGDNEAAARVAAMLAFAAMNMRGDAAVASGWHGRARSLLRSQPESPGLVMVAGLQRRGDAAAR